MDVAGAIDGPLQHLPARSIVKDPKKPRLRPRAKLTLVSARLSWDAPWLSTRYCHVKAESMEFII